MAPLNEFMNTEYVQLFLKVSYEMHWHPAIGKFDRIRTWVNLEFYVARDRIFQCPIHPWRTQLTTEKSGENAQVSHRSSRSVQASAGGGRFRGHTW